MISEADPAFIPTQISSRQGRAFGVREYTPDDFRALVGMYKGFAPKRVAQGLPPPDVPRIAHWLDCLQLKSRGLLALDAERIVAHALLCPISDAAVELTVFVHQDYRCRGLGAALAGRALELAAQSGFGEVFVITEPSNAAALRMYHKLGFETVSRFDEECELRLAISRSESAQANAA